MSEEINPDRRRFVANAAMTMAVAQAGMIGSATAQTTQATLASGSTIKSGTNPSFGSLKQINAGLLNVGYAEAGPADGPAVILMNFNHLFLSLVGHSLGHRIGVFQLIQSNIG